MGEHRRDGDRGATGGHTAPKSWMPLLSVGIFSAALNMLALTGTIYMLQIYDRVLPSHSLPTLVALSLLMIILYLAYGVLDLIRTKMMARVGVRIERRLRERVLNGVMLLPLRRPSNGDGLQPVRDLDQIRGFLSGLGPTALFDLPWIPFYLLIVYLLHPWLGLLGLAGAGVLAILALLTEFRSSAPSRAVSQTGVERHALSEAVYRNAEAIRALGMSQRISNRWWQASEDHLAQHIRMSDVISTYGSLTKVFRMMLQSAVLGLGAYLTINGQTTGGVMIAASILVARAVAPVEVAVAHWRGFVAARQSWSRLSRLLAATEQSTNPLQLEPPSKSLDVEALWAAPPGQQRAVINNVSFRLEAGEGLGIIGPSASGKSTLVRMIAGVWLPLRGTVRIDGATLDQWSPDALGRHIGYLPQNIELFAGTIADNIARFDPDATSDSIMAAARAAGVHDMILRLADGYQTQIGPEGANLSAGQRQRIALARALYGDPFLVILDEPNSNLDAAGDAALSQAIESVRARGGIVLVVAHRPSALAGLGHVLILADGRVQAFGPKDEVLRAQLQRVPPGNRPPARSERAMPPSSARGE
ncbi:MAG: type I secretion system permease/ATPase [Hyphomicrobiaceae bacterium]|nr:type I secretion system permease/ATPase [Hyphomicrobiaceae bacterium]